MTSQVSIICYESCFSSPHREINTGTSPFHLIPKLRNCKSHSILYPTEIGKYSFLCRFMSVRLTGHLAQEKDLAKARPFITETILQLIVLGSALLNDNPDLATMKRLILLSQLEKVHNIVMEMPLMPWL